MLTSFKVLPLAAGAALVALGAPASADTYIYNYYGESGATPRIYTPPARTYYYSAPTLQEPPATTYYYGPSTYVEQPPASTYYYAPPPRYYYRDPVYEPAPLFSLEALLNPYSSSSIDNPYRLAPGN